ncbi:MAG TPA: cupin domain-containing protein [Candidatus Dormibacteraeota bacterium]|jgi:quercetin dioxygenase-like cupin family protein
MTTFASIRDLRPHLIREGIAARVVNGERITMAVVDLEPGVVLPEHRHENEQLGFVISGVITMRIGGAKKELHPGETYSIPSNVPHDAEAGPEGCTVTDVFTPVRADWEKLPRSEASAGRWP